MQNTKSIIINHMDSSADSPPPTALFKCGCGTSLHSKADFKAHSSLKHNGFYVEGGSHYVCKFTEVVLPALPSTKATKKMDKPKEKANAIKKENPNKRGRPKMSQDNLPSSKRAKSLPLLAQTKAKQEHPNNLSAEDSIFQLIENTACAFEPYYCGKCETRLSQANEFIAHCIEVCQSLSNPASSHFIASRFDSQLQPSQCQHEQEHNRPRQSMQIDNRDCDTMFLMFRELFDHRNEPFYCGGCAKAISRASYWKHMNNVHSQMVPTGSSHILLRMRRGGRESSLYFSPSVAWESSEAAYYCPCKPEVNLHMQALLRHVAEVHRGISPFY